MHPVTGGLPQFPGVFPDGRERHITMRTGRAGQKTINSSFPRSYPEFMIPLRLRRVKSAGWPFQDFPLLSTLCLSAIYAYALSQRMLFRAAILQREALFLHL